jgi:hypothetical protein
MENIESVIQLSREAGEINDDYADLVRATGKHFLFPLALS